MAKRQGPQSFVKRQRERAKQAKNLEKQQRRFEKKDKDSPNEGSFDGYYDSFPDSDQGDEASRERD